MEGCGGSETSSYAKQKSESLAEERTGNDEDSSVKEVPAVDVESSERNVPDRDHTVSSLSEIITLDSTADSSVITLDNSSCDSSSMKTDVENKSSDVATASDVISLDSTANSSVEEVQFITQADSSSMESDVQDKNNDAVASASGGITLDSTANSCAEEVQLITQAGTSGINECMQDTNSTKDTPSNNIITLDTTANSSVEDIQEITQADSSGMKEDMQNTSKGVSASSSSMFTLDSTVDSSIEEIQGIADVDSSSRKGDMQGTDSDIAGSPNGMFTIDATADDIVEDIQEEEVTMPEGISLDMEGDEEECSVGPVSRLDIVPSYDASFTGILTDVEYNMETGKKINDALPKMCCFNCLGDHNVSDCPKPQDMQRIAANRKKHNVTRVPNVRYHEDGENKFGHFQPGKLSENLRYALGLRPNQLPIFVYRMRVLGYPPGWLRDAEVHQADMKLYDATGKSVSHPDLEDGETDPVLVKYKPEKLVSFPGFNDAMPHRTREEGHLYNCPPMQPYHQRTEFLKYMNMNRAQAYKKKKLKSSSLKGNNTSEADAVLAAEMEVDDSELNRSAHIEFNPPLPSEPLPPPPPDDLPEPPPPPPEEKDMEEGEISEDSQASLGDLEEKRLKILRELEDAASQGATDEQKSKKEENPTPTKDRSSKTDVKSEAAETSEESRTSNRMSSDPSESENSLSSDTLESASKKMKQHHRSHSKGFKLGAAIPESCTPFTALPSADLWKVDVSDHINFDNLPDALGTWDKMKGLMNNIRKRVRELQAEEDE